jgi:peptidoglycan/xylan/chitin deacetylase (PgdA/CDA1 family)
MAAATKWLLQKWLVMKGNSARPCVALTFDDGPCEPFTSQVLDVLASHNARATFFLVGNRVVPNKSILSRMKREGHEIGNHSMTHPEFAAISLSSMHQEICSMDDLIEAERPSGIKPWFRPPKGIISLRTMIYAVSHRRRYVLWSKDPKDFDAASAKQISSYFTCSPPVAGDIVLLHDKSEATVEALGTLLSELKHRGLTPVTVTDLLNY